VEEREAVDHDAFVQARPPRKLALHRRRNVRDVSTMLAVAVDEAYSQ